MPESIGTWFRSFWKSSEKPSVSPGQVWTIFGPNHIAESIGTIVVVFRTIEDNIQIYPTFNDSSYDRKIDLHLGEDELDFDANFYAFIDSLISLDKSSFADARFLGRLNQKGFDELLKARKKFYELSDIAANLQFVESKRDLTDEELCDALKEGIFDLLPSGVPAEEYIAFKESVIAALPMQEEKSTSIKTDKSNSKAASPQPIDRIDEILELKADLAKTPVSKRKAKILKNKAKKNEIILPILHKIAKVIVETGSEKEDFKLAYGILHNIIDLAPDDHEIALLYLISAKLASDETTKFEVNSEIPAVKLLLELDSANKIENLVIGDDLVDFSKFRDLTEQNRNAESSAQITKRKKKIGNN